MVSPASSNAAPSPPRRMPGDQPLRSMGFWTDSSITVQGTHGYAQVVNGNGWRAATRSSKGEEISGPGYFDPDYEQPLSSAIANWLDGAIETHPCNGEISYHGFEAMMALYISALERRPVQLPIDTLPDYSIIDRLRRELPERNEYAAR